MGSLRHRWLVTLLLLLMFGLAVTSLGRKSPTFDEQGFLVRGLAYLRGENRHMRVGHPLGLNALNAALLVSDESVRLPVDDASWAETSFHRPAELFLWEIGNDVAHVMFLARLPTVWLGMLLAALVGRWAWRVSGRGAAGLLALALLALDPNILAHTRLTTTDLGLAAGAALAGFALWRFLRQPTWSAAVLAGVGMGLLQNTKFTALLFVPLFAGVILVSLAARWRAEHKFPLRPLLMLLLVYPIAAILTLWAAYGFEIGTLSSGLPLLSFTEGMRIPLAHHLDQLLDIGGRVQTTTVSFLLGRISESGWWSYFPIAFMVKTPLPTLILLGWAVVRVIRGAWPGDNDIASRITDLASLLIPAGGFFLFAIFTDINIGYRHIIPVLPFLYVFAGVAILGGPIAAKPAQETGKGKRLQQVTREQYALLFGSALLVVTIWIYPHFLAYFNLLAGGPNNGWKVLVDSNLDWGQDLAGLADWQQEQKIDPLWLSYFGEGRPDSYDLDYVGLDSFPPRLMNPQANPFYPAEPAPGTYAISATNLQGVLFQDHDQFAWFREREPSAKIGYSIFIYDVPASGEAVALVLGGLQPADLIAADYALLGTNDVRAGWFNPDESLLIPGQGMGWAATRAGDIAFGDMLGLLSEAIVSNSEYELLQFHDDAADSLAAIVSEWPIRPDEELRFGDVASLMAARMETPAAGSDELIVTTAWRKVGASRPVKLFLHLQNEEGEIVTQWDGFGGSWEGWRDGDWWLQRHALPLPDDVAAGVYHLAVGLYEPESGTRWLTEQGSDQFSLGEVVLP